MEISVLKKKPHENAISFTKDIVQGKGRGDLTPRVKLIDSIT